MKATLFFTKTTVLCICVCLIVFACSKERALSSGKDGVKEVGAGTQKQKMLANGENGSTGDCYRYFQDHAFDSNALKTLHECVWSSTEWTCLNCYQTPPVTPEPRPSLCDRFPFLCQAYWFQPTGRFPQLLQLLGLTDSSSRTEIGIVHDSLQKYHAIIAAAVAANPDWINYNKIFRQTQILAYYKDVYLLTNSPLSTADFNFFVAYVEVLFCEEIPRIGDVMMVPPVWAYKLFYDTVQPIEYPDVNGQFSTPFFMPDTDPNSILITAGIQVGFLPLVTMQN